MELRKSWFHPEPKEEVLTVIRHHWFVIFRRMIWYLFLAIIPFLVWQALYLFGLEELVNNPVERALTVLGGSLFYLFLIVLFFHDWVDYYLDIWIITNHRIIDINQRGMFSRIVSQYRLERIQDVTADVSGLFQTVLNFGNLRIETAGAEAHLAMEEIAGPRELVQKLHSWSHKRQEEVHPVTNPDN